MSGAERQVASALDAATDLHRNLLEMAPHGRRGSAAVVLGGKTIEVLTRGTIPVLVYREG